MRREADGAGEFGNSIRTQNIPGSVMPPGINLFGGMNYLPSIAAPMIPASGPSFASSMRADGSVLYST